MNKGIINLKSCHFVSFTNSQSRQQPLMAVKTIRLKADKAFYKGIIKLTIPKTWSITTLQRELFAAWCGTQEINHL